MWLRELPENILTEPLLIEFSQNIGKYIIYIHINT